MQLRPTNLDDIIGQRSIKACLKILIQAHVGNPLPHMIWTGPPGTGKTTFATALANECNRNIMMANGGNIRKTKDILPYLVRIKFGDILFIDEVHRVDVRVQESLFTVMEDFRFDVARGAKSLDIEPFTLIGATTESGLLIQPFYDRFKHHFQLEEYTNKELEVIITCSAKKLGFSTTEEAARGLAQASRLTPRIANSLLEWCCDYAKSINVRLIDRKLSIQALNLKKIDNLGLDSDDRRYIMVLERAGKPLGLNTLVAATGLSRNTIEHRIEPHLIRCGMIWKTNKGRSLI